MGGEMCISAFLAYENENVSKTRDTSATLLWDGKSMGIVADAPRYVRFAFVRSPLWLQYLQWHQIEYVAEEGELSHLRTSRPESTKYQKTKNPP